jgi:hypothetical protein
MHALRELGLAGDLVIADQIEAEAELAREVDRDVGTFDATHASKEKVSIATHSAGLVLVEVEVAVVNNYIISYE